MCHSGGSEPLGHTRGGVVEEHRDPMVVTEMADGGEGTQIDRVHVLNVVHVHDQAHRPHPANRVDQRLAQIDRVLGIERAVRLNDETSRPGRCRRRPQYRSSRYLPIRNLLFFGTSA